MFRPTLLTLVATAPFAITNARADWDDEFRSTFDPEPQLNCLLARDAGGRLFALWPDWTDFEDTQVRLMSSPDGGVTWSHIETVFSGAAYDQFEMAADEDGLHVLLVEFTEDDEDEYKQLYYTFSDDNGASFTEPSPVGEHELVEEIRILVAGGEIYVGATQQGEEDSVHYFFRSDDGGKTWTQSVPVESAPVRNPHYSIADGTLYLVYAGSIFSPEIQFVRSDDSGATWSAPVGVSSGAGVHSQLPRLAIDGDGALHAIWEDDREGHYQVYHARSVDGGATWSSGQRLNTTEYGARPRLRVVGDTLHAVWCQYHGDSGWPSTWSNFDYGIIRHRSSTDGGLTWSPETRVSQNEAVPTIELPDRGANHVRLFAEPGGFTAIWQDKRDGNTDLYIRTFAANACPADIDGDGAGDGSLDILDVLQFLAWFAALDPRADLAPPLGVLDFSDVVAYLIEFTTGCP